METPETIKIYWREVVKDIFSLPPLSVLSVRKQPEETRPVSSKAGRRPEWSAALG